MIKRRLVLAGMTGAAAQPLLAFGGGADGPDPREDLIRIGRAALRAGAVERDEFALRAALGLLAHQDPPTRFGPAWCGIIAEDFAEGRTAMVEGWVLSLTEARLCALLACATAPMAGI